MKTYTFLIGTTDDFESMDEMLNHFENSSYPDSICNCSAFEFEAPESCDHETVTIIGRGIAFSNDWAMDDTFSCVIEGTLDGAAEQDMFEAGAAAREKLKEQNRSETQSVDPYEPFNSNDPINW